MIYYIMVSHKHKCIFVLYALKHKSFLSNQRKVVLEARYVDEVIPENDY